MRKVQLTVDLLLLLFNHFLLDRQLFLVLDKLFFLREFLVHSKLLDRFLLSGRLFGLLIFCSIEHYGTLIALMRICVFNGIHVR